MRALWVSAVCCLMLSSCVTSPPRQTEDICSIFADKSRWYTKARKAEQRWGSPISTTMAIMHQESGFRAKAKPPRRKILWVIPGPRKSDAYGYAQAKDSTWRWYRDSTGRSGADRDKFGDAIDFIAWYNATSQKKLGIKPTDTHNLYLAYHEGHGGFRRGTYQNKTWLTKVAAKVTRRANRYQQQLSACEKRLKKRAKRWFF